MSEHLKDKTGVSQVEDITQRGPEGDLSAEIDSRNGAENGGQQDHEES